MNCNYEHAVHTNAHIIAQIQMNLNVVIVLQPVDMHYNIWYTSFVKVDYLHGMEYHNILDGI